MDLMLVLLAVTGFPVGCLAFVLWMGTLEDTIPADVRRAVRRPDPPPILAVPVRRTAAAGAPGRWESVVADADPALIGREPRTRPGGTPHSTGANPPLDAIPEQRTPALPALPALPAPEPLAGT
ncbi:MAG TPA: hypothetical protein VFV40_07005 [Nocardioides sp.]|nr:hypothetical protein [Nocardioides sp.]